MIFTEFFHGSKKTIGSSQKLSPECEGHGTKLRDDNSDEADGYDEALVPRDFQENGMIRDDDLYEILVKDLADGVHLVSLMDCCHSGTMGNRVHFNAMIRHDFFGFHLKLINLCMHSAVKTQERSWTCPTYSRATERWAK